MLDYGAAGRGFDAHFSKFYAGQIVSAEVDPAAGRRATAFKLSSTYPETLAKCTENSKGGIYIATWLALVKIAEKDLQEVILEPSSAVHSYIIMGDGKKRAAASAHTSFLLFSRVVFYTKEEVCVCGGGLYLGLRISR